MPFKNKLRKKNYNGKKMLNKEQIKKHQETKTNSVIDKDIW